MRGGMARGGGGGGGAGRGGMSRYSCGSAYGAQSNTAFPGGGKNAPLDMNEYLSYLHNNASQNSNVKPQTTEQKNVAVNPSEQEIYPGIKTIGETFDVFMLVIALPVVIVTLIGGCFLLGWVSNAKATLQQPPAAAGAQTYAATQRVQPVPVIDSTHQIRYYYPTGYQQFASPAERVSAPAPAFAGRPRSQ